MSMIDDLAERLTAVLGDNALRGALMEACPALRALADAPPPRPKPVPLPPMAEITALQMTWFDNGKNCSGDRFKFGIEVFTEFAVPGRDAAITALNSPAFTHDEMVSKLRRWRVADMDTWRDDMKAIVAAHKEPDWMFVPLMSKANGTTYFEGQFILVKVEKNRAVEATLFNGGEVIKLTKFTTKTSTGKTVSGNAKQQVRLCRTGDLTKWASQVD